MHADHHATGPERTTGKRLATGERVATGALVAGLAAALLAGCSVKRAAVDLLGAAIAGGAGVYTSDDDPELIRGALPFGLKR